MNTQVLGHIPLFHTPHSMFTELGAGGNFEGKLTTRDAEINV